MLEPRARDNFLHSGLSNVGFRRLDECQSASEDNPLFKKNIFKSFVSLSASALLAGATVITFFPQTWFSLG